MTLFLTVGAAPAAPASCGGHKELPMNGHTIDLGAFTFDSDALPPNARVVHVSAAVESESEMMDVFDRQLEFPYFGHNWNALMDCMRDLKWIVEPVVVIANSGLPCLPPKDRKTYLLLVSHMVLFWRQTDGHRLIVTFPSSSRDEISLIAQEINRDAGD